MHRRKEFLVYPPTYTPGVHKFYRFRSKRKAWAKAVTLGAGASVDVSVRIHPAARTPWRSSFGRPLWDVARVG